MPRSSSIVVGPPRAGRIGARRRSRGNKTGGEHKGLVQRHTGPVETGKSAARAEEREPAAMNILQTSPVTLWQLRRGADGRMSYRRGLKWRPAFIDGPFSGSRFSAAGGDGGIRTLDRALQPYNGLANRRLQPLGHVSVHAENGVLWMRSHMLAEVCPSPGAMARPAHAAGTRGLCALQQSHAPVQKRQPAKLRFTRPAPTLSCGYRQEED